MSVQKGKDLIQDKGVIITVLVVEDKDIIESIVNFQAFSKGQIELHKECNFDAIGFKAAAGDAGDDDCQNTNSGYHTQSIEGLTLWVPTTPLSRCLE